CYQAPPPPPPPPPPEDPPPPKPLEPLPAGVEATAVEMLEFIDWRLLAISAAWKGRLPTYQPSVLLVSMPSNALAHFDTQPKTIAYGRSWVKISAFSANCWRYFSAVFMYMRKPSVCCIRSRPAAVRTDIMRKVALRITPTRPMATPTSVQP